nr:uncharacterized protein LOC124814927 [Hydra vulgaris]
MVKKTHQLWCYFAKIQALNEEDKSNPKVICQIKVPAGTGPICGKVLSTPNSSSMRTHIRSLHPEQARAVISFEAAWYQKRLNDTKKLDKLYNQVEKITSNKKKDQSDHSDSTLSNSGTDVDASQSVVYPNKRQTRKKLFRKLPIGGRASFVTTTPPYFQRIVKHNVRSPVQLKFDLAVMKYLAGSNLAFNHVNEAAFRNFVKYLDPKFHVKSARSMVRAKFSLLNRLVKEAVTNKIVTDLKDNAVGVAFTTDLWSSK